MLLVSSNDTFDIIKRRLYISSKDDNGASKAVVTHTRIGDKALNIPGGRYHVSDENESVFLNKYVKHVLMSKNASQEYMTEIQLNTGEEPILVDLDFRYPLDTTTRLYTKDTINHVLDLYLAQLPKLFAFTDRQTFPVFIFERNKMYKKYKKDELAEVKDGIHMVFGLQLAHKYQMVLRNQMISACTKENPFESMHLVKGLEDVFDDKISAGTSGWQMYGSCKPGCEPYCLTQYIQCTFDASDGQFQTENRNVAEFLSPENICDNFKLLCARYKHNLKPNLQDNIDKLIRNGYGSDSKAKRSYKKKENNALTLDALSKVTCAEELDATIEQLLISLKSTEFQVRDAHNLAQLLPEEYYQDGSHLKNRLVAFVLKRVDGRLFWSWIKLRSKADDFDYAEIPDLYDKWVKYFNADEDKEGVSFPSLVRWVRDDAPEQYETYKNNNVNELIEDIIRVGYTDGKISRLLKVMCGDMYKCTDIKTQTIYKFIGHRWSEDKGCSLRSMISGELRMMFEKKSAETLNEFIRMAQDETPDMDANADIDELSTSGDKKKTESEGMARIKKRMKKIAVIVEKLDSTVTKNHGFRESMEEFFDGDFMRKLNTNPWLLCFNNGILDLKTGEFRNGQANDYISMCTNIDYHPMSYYLNKCANIVEDIKKFFSQLFPIPDLERYMWDHLGSVLIGEQVEQAFNVYIGSGSNGKSLLCDLLRQCLGEYKAHGPPNMLTDKRVAVGGTSSDLMNMKTARYVCFQETDKNVPINESFVKEITGEPVLTGRDLFSKTETFILQTKFAACMNELFKVSGTDDGIWRRLKVVGFYSKFVDEGEKYEHESKYVFKKDRSLKEKLPVWAPIFMSMLVDIAVKNQGVVKDCEEVIKYTNEFRQSQDIIQCFMDAKIERCPPESKCQIGSQNLHRAYKEWYNSVYNDNKAPKVSELDKVMDKRFGDRKSQPNHKWKNVRIIVETDDDDDVFIDSANNV